MKIAMVFDGLQTGGIERVGVDYARLFRELGHEVDAYNLRPALNAMEGDMAKYARVFRLNFPRWFAPERYAATVNKAWWGKFVYPVAFCIMGLVDWLYRPFIRLALPATRGEYDAVIAFSGHVNDLTVTADRIIKGKKKAAWLHGALYGYAVLSPAYCRLYTKIINLVCLSELCDTEFYRYFQANRIHKQRIYNPIFIGQRPIDTALVAELKEKYGDFCLMVARLADDKDQKTAMDAVALMNQKYGTAKKLLLVGDGPNRAALESYAQEHGLTEQVAFIGNRTDVQNFYTAATVYVHSSPAEGLPTVLLEAMNYGLPIASTDSIPGVREILQNERCGLISAVYDADGLAENIHRLYTDPALAGRLIQNGRTRIRDFRPDAIRAQIDAFLKELQ